MISTFAAQDYGLLFKFLKHRSSVFDLDLKRKAAEVDSAVAEDFLSAFKKNYRVRMLHFCPGIGKQVEADILPLLNRIQLNGFGPLSFYNKAEGTMTAY